MCINWVEGVRVHGVQVGCEEGRSIERAPREVGACRLALTGGVRRVGRVERPSAV